MTERGATRPDFCNEQLRLVIDVKNYELCADGSMADLVDDIVETARFRERHLPPGMRQGVYIDPRGQDVSRRELDAIRDEIARASGGLIIADNVGFLGDE